MINTASSMTHVGRYGAIMREHEGPAIACAGRCIARSINYHEFQSIKAGLEVAVKYNKTKVEINSVSVVAVQTLNKKIKPDWQCRTIVREIMSIIDTLEWFRCNKIYKETNRGASIVSKIMIEIGVQELKSATISEALKIQVKDDENGKAYFRRYTSTYESSDIKSPRDTDGLGSHTSSITAGVVPGASYYGPAEGVAREAVPKSRISVYKVCWFIGCNAADVLAAFDVAIADGVDIISVSLGAQSSLDYFDDVIAIGSFHAMRNGILTSNSAGYWPDRGLIPNYSPWSLIVSAITIDRKFLTRVVLGSGQTFMYLKGLYSWDSLNSLKVDGKIVLCDTFKEDGVTGVLMANGVGTIISDSAYLDFEVVYTYPIPAIIIRDEDGDKIRNDIKLFEKPFATILVGETMKDGLAPTTYSFSAKGLNPISLDILKMENRSWASSLGQWPMSALATPLTTPVCIFHLLTVKIKPSVLKFSYAGEKKTFKEKVYGPEIVQVPILSELGVVSVFSNTPIELHPTRSWDFMGFTQSTVGDSYEGNIIIGMFDTGIWPESKSFNDEGFGPPPAKWNGTCETGDNNFTCNNKVMGARFYDSENIYDKTWDIKSPRDSEGHGSHTASTAAGQVVEGASYYGQAEGIVRGGVPKARIAVYRVCWYHGCFPADILAAFNDAIADGVDIISISLGFEGIIDYFEDPIAIGSFHAMRKGILTSNSAGNSGKPYSVANYSPWSLTVAASTIDRVFLNEVVLGNGQMFDDYYVSLCLCDCAVCSIFHYCFIKEASNSLPFGMKNNKPDLTAPGVNILAAWSPLGSPSIDPVDDRSVNYNIISGTSMECPHATGAPAAYVKALHPAWSPAAIKSALMTSGE
ncbi:hypothetical protein GIB67_019194 [Kingdonia uniflora]|uniref:Cucumisin n=1 Tax=Kingdonia uniflora TaxID=39325 RepID=A0A7J7MZR7_9MAGN|nr:hypothetical protein GIB67_019194 [Kingdonia uniflora]